MLLVPQNMNCVHLKCFKIFSPYSILLYKSLMVTDLTIRHLLYTMRNRTSLDCLIQEHRCFIVLCLV